jgi:hypothetical protein
VIRVDDEHVIHFHDVQAVHYDGQPDDVPGTYVTLMMADRLWQFNHRDQYVTMVPLNQADPNIEQYPMTARTRNDLAHAVPLI